MSGTLFVVATPIGNLEDITMRALRVLREAAVIAAEDTRRTGHLLARYGIQTPTTSLHEHNETRKAAALVARLQGGDSIALVSDAGTPTISDPGLRFIQQAIAAGIRVEPIPGPNAAIATLSVAGFDSDRFSFLGFPPTKSNDRSQWFGRLRESGPLVVFYESPHRLRETMQDLQRAVGDCQVVIGRELTKAHEELVRGPISIVLNRLPEPRGEFTVVAEIGHLTNNGRAEPIDDREMLVQFCQITNDNDVSRRRAISLLSSRHRISANEVYAAIERAKKLVE